MSWRHQIMTTRFRECTVYMQYSRFPCPRLVNTYRHSTRCKGQGHMAVINHSSILTFLLEKQLFQIALWYTSYILSTIWKQVNSHLRVSTYRYNLRYSSENFFLANIQCKTCVKWTPSAYPLLTPYNLLPYYVLIKMYTICFILWRSQHQAIGQTSAAWLLIRVKNNVCFSLARPLSHLRLRSRTFHYNLNRFHAIHAPMVNLINAWNKLQNLVEMRKGIPK